MYKIVRNIFLSSILISFIAGCLVRKNDETSLRKRLNEFVKLTAEMKFDSALNYTYPKLFNFIPRNKLKEGKEEAFQFTMGKAKLDSFRIDTIYPVFQADKANYAWAIYSMIMEIPIDSAEKVSRHASQMKMDSLRKTNQYPAPSQTLMTTLISEEFGVKVISFHEDSNITRVRMGLLTICVRDNYAKDWSFYTVMANDTIVTKLFPEKVLNQFKSYTK